MKRSFEEHTYDQEEPVIERDHDQDRDPECEAGRKEGVGFVHLRRVFCFFT